MEYHPLDTDGLTESGRYRVNVVVLDPTVAVPCFVVQVTVHDPEVADGISGAKVAVAGVHDCDVATPDAMLPVEPPNDHVSVWVTSE